MVLPQTRRQWLWLAVRLLVVGLVVWGLSRALDNAIDDLRDKTIDWSQLSFGWLAASGGLYLLGFLPMGIYWHRILVALGQRPRLGETLAAFYIGHLGKYVPGKALVVVLRAGLIRGVTVDTTVAAVSIFLETLTMMSVGAFLAAAIIAVQFAEHWQMTALAVALMCAAGLPTLPPIFRRLVKLLRVGKLNPEIEEHLRGLSLRLIAEGWLANLLGWTCLGASLWATLQALPLDLPELPAGEMASLVVASVALGIVAGFITPIPGGLGVREWVLNQMMVPAFGALAALVASVLLRLVWLLSEVVISIMLYLVVCRGRKPGAPPLQASSESSAPPLQP